MSVKTLITGKQKELTLKKIKLASEISAKSSLGGNKVGTFSKIAGD